MTDAAPALPQGKRYLTIRQTAQVYPALTESALRWLRFNGDGNGFNRCVLAVGRKVLIDAEAFERWVESHRSAGPSLQAASGNHSTPGTTPKARIPPSSKRPVVKPPVPARKPRRSVVAPRAAVTC